MQIDPFEYIKSLSLPKPKTVLQVGASGGQEIPLYLKNEIKKAIFIEPLDYPFEILCQNLNGIDDYFPIKSLVGAEDDVNVRMYVSSNDGQSSSILKPANHKTIFPNVYFNEEHILKSFTLDTIVNFIANQNPKFQNKFDLLYVDVQGAELEVFKGARKVLLEAQYIFTEVGYGGGYDGDASYMDIINYLKSFKYNLAFLNINPITGYGDALFSKSNLVQ
jgi:FkbM family methyltransferase